MSRRAALLLAAGLAGCTDAGLRSHSAPTPDPAPDDPAAALVACAEMATVGGRPIPDALDAVLCAERVRWGVRYVHQGRVMSSTLREEFAELLR